MDYQELIPEKSPNDSRNYCGMNLSNGLTVLLIHDPTLEKSACSVSVGVGSLQNVDRSLGIAHFLEHMLFMGSTKYPEHNSYTSFISNNSGFDNAYTADEETNFYFEVKNSAFCEATERLANFFTGALLNETCIEKERQAVHEEYVLGKNDDSCRKWEVLKKLAVGPFRKFSIGNNQTLNHPSIREDLVQFYNKYYSSNIIKSTVCSQMSIQEMKTRLLPFFEAIPNKHVEKPKYDVHFKEGSIGKLIRMQSIKDETFMEFFWAVQDLRPLFKHHAQDYICHVIGHEGEASLLSLLKNFQYATEIVSYTRDLLSQTLIVLEIKLTEEGGENYEQIYNIVTDYVGSLKVEQHVFDEIKERNMIKFKFKEKAQISHYACRLSSKMHEFPLHEVLNHSVLFQEYNPEMIEKIFKKMNPFNLAIVLSNSDPIEGAEEEKYFGAKYRIENLPERKISGFKFGNLRKNEFIPINTDIHVPETVKGVEPKKLSDSIFFLPNGQFKVCKGGIELTLESSQNFQFKAFYAKYLELLLKEVIYNAEALEISINIEANRHISIELFGFNDTLIKLLDCIGERLWELHEGDRSEKIFQLALDDIIEEYENFYCEEADEISDDTLDLILNEGYPSIEQIKQGLEELEYDDVQNRARKLSCCIVYYEVGPYSEQLYHRVKLLRDHIDEPFFNALRTEKQLAYYLAVKVANVRKVLGLEFLLVSSTKDAYQISVEIKEFVNGFFGKLDENLCEEKLVQLKNSIETKIIAPHNNLKELNSFVGKEIHRKTFYFHRKTKETVRKYLDPITLQQLKELTQSFLKKSLDIYTVCKGHKEAYEAYKVNAKSFEAIKQNAEYYQE